MPNEPITGLPSITPPLSGTELLPIESGGTTYNVNVSDLSAFTQTQPFVSTHLIQGSPVKMQINGTSEKSNTSVTLGINGTSFSVASLSSIAHIYTLPAGAIILGDVMTYHIELLYKNNSSSNQTGEYQLQYEINGTPLTMPLESFNVVASGFMRGYAEVRFQAINSSTLGGQVLIGSYSIKLFDTTSAAYPAYENYSSSNDSIVLGSDTFQVSSLFSSSAALFYANLLASSFTGYF